MATLATQAARLQPTRVYRPLFLDRSGDLRPSVERELTSISNATWDLQGQIKKVEEKIVSGVAGVASFAGRTGAVVPAAADYAAFYEPKGSGGGTVDSYTKAESDAKYAFSATTYTKTEADNKFALKGSGGGSFDPTQPQTISGAWVFTHQPQIRLGVAAAQDITTQQYVDTNFVKLGGVKTITGSTHFNGTVDFNVLPQATTNAPTPLNAKDFVTKEYVDSHAGGGSSTVNEVSLAYIGETKWHSSQVPIPAFAVEQSGQLLKRSDYPELWAKIESGEIKSVDDATWIATPTGRAQFTKGTITTGADANFRVPDLNGLQLNSIKGLFVRGSTMEDPNAGGIGVIRQNAAPNITGSLSTAYSSTVATLEGFTGAFGSSGAVTKVFNPTSISQDVSSRADTATFNASHSSAAYGRNSSVEVRPNSVSGLWILIAKKPDIPVKIIDSGIGMVHWTNQDFKTHANAPESFIWASGQIINRADEPELWALVENGVLPSVTDALWLDNGIAGEQKVGNRGMYSTGDGTTTFRVPDLNSAVTDTYGHLYLSAISRNTVNKVGVLGQSSAPDIVGSFQTLDVGGNELPTGAFSQKTSNAYGVTASGSSGSFDETIEFHASRSNPVYGRGGATNEIVPNTAFGSWVIKARSVEMILGSGGSSTPVDAYTKAESDAALALKADKSDTYTKTEVDNAIAAAGGGGSGDVTAAGDNTFTGVNIFKNGIRLANDQTKGIRGADDNYNVICSSSDGTVSVGNIHSPVIIQGSNMDMNTSNIVDMADPVNPQDAATKAYVDGKMSGGGITVPETLTNMDTSDSLVTGWYWTDYHTTPSMSAVPNNYGDFAIVNHVVAKQTTDNKGFCYQTMFTGGENFTDIKGQTTYWFRVSADGAQTHWGPWTPVSAGGGGSVNPPNYDKWIPFEDPAASTYFDVSAGHIDTKELWVKIGFNSIQVKGNIHLLQAGGATDSNKDLFSLSQMLSGYTKVNKSYGQCILQTNHVNNNSVGATLTNKFQPDSMVLPLPVSLFGNATTWGGSTFFVIDELFVFS